MTGISALPLAQEEGGGQSHQKFRGASRILGPKWSHLPTLTIGLLGVQIFWSVEMSYASPYLLSLGLSKSKMAIVFVAGPLSGLVMQPLIGILADSCTSRFGRRRPYMMVGTIICGFAMLLLGFTRWFASIFTGWDNNSNDLLTIWLAVFAIYFIDFSINAVMAVDRALLVDTLPSTSQPRVSHSILVSAFSRLLTPLITNLSSAWLGWFPILFYTTIYIGDLYKRSSPIPFTDEARATLDAEATRSGSRALFWSSVVSLVSNVVLPVFVTESASSSGDEPQKPHLRFGYGSRDHWWTRLERLVRVPMWMRIHMANLWALSHLVFAGCMFATFLTSSVTGASFMISVTGFSWAVSQWAPFSLLGTAILTESSDDDDTAIRLTDTRTRPRRVNSSDLDVDVDAGEANAPLLEDASDSGEENEVEPGRKEERRKVLGNLNAQVSRVNISGVSNGGEYQMVNGGSENGTTREVPSGGGLSAKAGIILGIHNIFIVIPQFLVTGFSSLIFAIFDPQNTGVPQHHGPVHAPISNSTDVKILIANGTEPLARVTRSMFTKWLEVRQDVPEWAEEDGSATVYEGSNSVVYIFRIGGVAAAIAAVLSWRLARELRYR
ncbi:hypothetical protein P691DRAFT_664570 [Macrolepiota fuliginosa MF-IS2]|uniref:MFS general substrate transporter n=1 Tax=Macrolepiota fuliginosa MF-IS2 TaxID=1400762 RepID=A0A9P5XG45_9AGAR|nr:hypothetical protein P691DRAFT_664570 [Macrolepiota fuliginosa MF-IS2]